MKIARAGMVTDYITEALLIMIRKMPYSEITISSLCKKAGVTRMSFYRNYTTKEDVLRAWIADITDDFLKKSAISYKNDTTTEYFRKLFTHLRSHKDICLAIYRAGLIHLIKDQFDQVFLALHKEEYDEYKSYFLAGGVYNIFLIWLIHGCKETPEELAAKVSTILER